MDSEQGDLSSVLDSISSCSGDVFYNLVKEFVGVIEGEILEIQRIKNVRILLQVPDVFSFFRLNCKDTFQLKQKACFIADDMQFMVRPGIKSNIERFIELLRKHHASKSINIHSVASEIMPNGDKQTNQCICNLLEKGNEEYESHSFADIFVVNLLKNMKRASNNYRFDPLVTKFASVLNILAGHNAYEFIRINLPGALPSIITLKNYNQTINDHLKESEFRFDSLTSHLDSIESKHVFVSEDSTGIVSSIYYDTMEDSFIGFTPPLNNGLPIVNHFRTNSYNELEQWFQSIERSTLVNVTLIEPLLTNENALVHSRPYIVSAYGTNNKYSAVDVLRKWIYAYNELKKREINVVGFSSDCDSRYLKAMQLSLGFFAKAPNIDLLSGYDQLLHINIPKHWKFFFMRSTQLFLTMQDGIHLVTKIRNRLLSDTATLYINNERVDVNHLLEIITNHPKIDHNLVKSDVFPHDRQNYSSCLKITSDDVLTLLEQRDNKATFVYLYLLKLVILTYVKKDTDILSRLFFGWIVAFSYRIWWCSIHVNRNLSQLEKENFFITKAAWLSSEINIHCLTSIIILVCQGHLPPYTLNSHLFSSQPCEATFRSARSLTGTFSSMGSFSIYQFLSKSDKISILNQIKSTEESSDKRYSLKFPIHHKNRRNEMTTSTNSLDISSITHEDIEKIIIKAYHRAESIMDILKLSDLLKKNKLNDLNQISSCVFSKLDERSTVDHTKINSYDGYDSLDDDEENHVSDQVNEIDYDDLSDDSGEDDQEENHLTTSKQTFEGMRVYERVNPAKIDNYFEISINNKLHYMHKQTAARLLTLNKNRLSSDRLLRVQQTGKQK